MSNQILEATEADVFGILSATPALALAKIIRADDGLTTPKAAGNPAAGSSARNRTSW